MDAESPQLSNASPERTQLSIHSFRHSSEQETQCLVCRRAFSLEAEVNEGFEAISICRECKTMVLEDHEGNVTLRDIRQRRRQRGTSRFGSSESIDSFSHQLSHVINLASQNQESHFEGNSPVTVRQRASYYAIRSRSQRRRHALSDNESDGLDHMDSMFGESDSNISFGGYGGDSDASLDRNSLFDREMFIQFDNESFIFTDTDIDPMHAGLDQWNSDDQDEEDGEWEEADFDENNVFVEQHQQFQDANSSPGGIGGRGAQDDAWVRWRMGANQQVHYADIFADLEELDSRPRYVGNPGDYLDARGFEELLEQLAENDGSRRGAPPAAASSVASLPSVIISKDHEKTGSLICPVCKDPLLMSTEAKQLPCRHLYHPSCILPWLAARNSCPVCRYELPTDDPEYEEGKRNMMNRNEMHGIQQQDPAEESSYEILSEMESDEGCEQSHGTVQQGSSEVAGQVADRSSREGRRGGWLFLAAAPIVSIVGMVIVLWFRSSRSTGRIHSNTQEQDSQQLHRSQSTGASSDRNRRWWSIF